MAAGEREAKGLISRHDEEAVIDRGRVSNVVNIHYEKEELEGESLLRKDSAPTEPGYHCKSHRDLH
uniref:Uncharacterized protein n=1 Tax=Athene cunicularia TaxID=194338 RepID=A0A663NAI1_ATHCN